MSNITVASFRWLDILEKELDKSLIDFDLSLSDLQNDSDNGDLIEETLIDFIENSREKLKTIGNVWAQLVHKSQTIFQVNCKLEAQLVNLNSDLVEAKAFCYLKSYFLSTSKISNKNILKYDYSLSQRLQFIRMLFILILTQYHIFNEFPSFFEH